MGAETRETNNLTQARMDANPWLMFMYMLNPTSDILCAHSVSLPLIWDTMSGAVSRSGRVAFV